MFIKHPQTGISTKITPWIQWSYCGVEPALFREHGIDTLLLKIPSKQRVFFKHLETDRLVVLQFSEDLSVQTG